MMSTLHKQNGFVLFMTLMIMVLMSIAGLALMRAVDSSTLIAGNIGYRQAAIISSDSAINAATTWLAANTLVADNAASGVFATDLTTFDWSGQNTTTTADDVDWDSTNGTIATKGRPVTFPNGSTTDASGNRAYYIISRLCDTPGSPNSVGTACATSTTLAAATGSTKSGIAYGQQASHRHLAGLLPNHRQGGRPTQHGQLFAGLCAYLKEQSC